MWRRNALPDQASVMVLARFVYLRYQSQAITIDRELPHKVLPALSRIERLAQMVSVELSDDCIYIEFPIKND